MFKMTRRNKHYRKLEKKADKIRRDIATHPDKDGWTIKVKPHRKKVKIKAQRYSSLGYPQSKEAVIGLKEELNLNKFLGKFQTQ